MRNKLKIVFIIITLGIILGAKTHRITFKFTPNVQPESVSLAGTFNNWSIVSTPMHDDNGDGIWTVIIELEDGEYQYKFVVNGEHWYQDLNNPLSAPDGYGGRNSIIRVGDYDKFQQSAVPGDGKILESAVLHKQDYPYFVFADDTTLYLKLRTKQDDVDSVSVIFDESEQRMDWYAFDGTFDYFIAELNSQFQQKFEYKFLIFDGDNNFLYDDDFTIIPDDIEIFYIPSWVENAIFYQIFPERFANGDKSNDPPDVQRWGEKPEYFNFFGGDLQGVLDNLDYLVELGINAIYFNPVFQAPSNHKYDMSDPMKIDPHFGSINLFKELVDSCHSLGIKIIIDGVFHDTGRKHWAFQDVIENEQESDYADWYNVHSYPVGPEDNPNYDCWWGFGSLPSLNTTNPEVRKYLFDVAKYWTRLGVDGWRLDCPNEVEDDFWLHFRDTIRSINPQAYILGEIWGDGSKWLQGDMFDAVMNYRFRQACIDFFAMDNIDASRFVEKYFYILATYFPNVNNVSFNLLGSHDTQRFLTLCNGNKNKLKLAWLFQMTTIGAPSIYYGDEIGMTGGKDPDCRKCFQWNKSSQDTILLNYMKKLIQIRKSHPIIPLGNVFKFEIIDEDCIAFYKKHNSEYSIVVINRGENEKYLSLQSPFEKDTIVELLSMEKMNVSDGMIKSTIPAYGGMIIVR